MILQILNLLTLLLFVPIGLIIFYLGKHLKDKNGEIGKLRKIIFLIKIGWIIYLSSQVIGRIFVGKQWNISQAELFIIVATIPITIIHWWAVFKLRQILT